MGPGRGTLVRWRSKACPSGLIRPDCHPHPFAPTLHQPHTPHPPRWAGVLPLMEAFSGLSTENAATKLESTARRPLFSVSKVPDEKLRITQAGVSTETSRPPRRKEPGSSPAGPARSAQALRLEAEKQNRGRSAAEDQVVLVVGRQILEQLGERLHPAAPLTHVRDAAERHGHGLGRRAALQ